MSGSAQPLTRVPSLDEIATIPELAAGLDHAAVLVLHARAVRALAALEGPLLLRANEESKEEPNDGRLLNAAEAADRLGVPESWLRDQARRGKLPFVQLGHYVRFRGEDLEGYIAEHRRA